MDSGYILLSRGLLDSDVFASQKLLKIWVWCLCKANFKDRFVPLKTGRGETVIKVKRGSFIFGRNKAEDELFIDGSTIYKSIKKLEKMSMIKIKSNNQYSIVTICKYDAYQNPKEYRVTTKEQPSNNEVTTKSLPSNTTNTLNNVKKDKKDINILFDVFWNLYDKKTGKAKCEAKWNKLTDKEREDIIAYLPSYINSTPDVKYRKNPITFFNNESWNDEIQVVKKKIVYNAQSF